MEVKKIVEFTPIQIKQILAKILRENGLIVGKIEFSASGAIAYVADLSEKIYQADSKDYLKENFAELGFSTKIRNLFRLAGLSTLEELQNYLIGTIASENSVDDAEKALLYIPNLGEASMREIFDLLGMKNLKINEDGTIVPIS